MVIGSRERQRRFKEKMYETGFKQMIVWITRKEPKPIEKMSMSKFISEIKKTTSEWDDEMLSQQFNLLIKIIKSKEEARRQGIF